MLSCLLVPVEAFGQSASDNAEARVFFEEGNRLYQRASRATGNQREGLLRRALQSYVDSLRVVRSRNAIFNAAIVLEELGRDAESFNYYTEYLGIEGLSKAERDEALARQDALRARVAVLEVTTQPAGATVWIDRKDLASPGRTPLDVALAPAKHSIIVEKEGYLDEHRTVSPVVGETRVIDIELQAAPSPIEAASPPVEPTPKVPLQTDAPVRPALRNGAIATAASTLATAAVGLGLSIRARTLRNEANRASAEYRETPTEELRRRADDLANRTDRFNVAADVFWGTTVALGVTAITLYAVHRKKRRKAERAGLQVAVSPHGGFASVRGRFGGPQ